MSESTRQQQCTACGSEFPVEASLPPEMSPTKCPACQQSGKMTEAEAIARVQQMGQGMGRDKDDPVYFYAQRIGIFTIVLCGCGLVMLLAYTQLSENGGIPIIGVLGLVTLGMAGGLLSYWAAKNSRPNDPFKDI